jgi:16S rRNA (adenine1518-N6/adenine1519-N6)-dimethyltransferase
MEHRARKRFGQNFLHDPAIIHRLVSAISPKSDDRVVEIGPGQGALTQPLLAQLDHLHAIELDRDLVPFLREQFTTQGLEVHEADALKFDFRQLLNEKPLRVVGNLPYNISTPLLFHLLSYQEKILDMHFMLQLEVVDRLAAKPGSKTYGRLSVITQYYCHVEKLFHVPPGAFNPPPKVMSAIVKLTPRQSEYVANNISLFEYVVKTSFSQRRKTLRNNLKQFLSLEQLDLLKQDLTLRPEQLSLQNFVELSNEIDVFNIPLGEKKSLIAKL